MNCAGAVFLEAKMADTLSWLLLFAAAFFFGIATTFKLVTWILLRKNEYAGERIVSVISSLQ